MLITNQVDYGVRMMVDLAVLGYGKQTSIADIARRQEVPKPFMRKIVSRLVAAELVATKKGKGGGITLNRSADTINLLQAVEAIDGPLAFTRCTETPSRCPRFTSCAVHPIWAKAQQQLREFLASVLLSDIAKSQTDMSSMLSITGG